MLNLAADHVHHFEMGGWLIILAYLTSVAGSFVGLACTMQSRYAIEPRSRIMWLAMAAVSIGGVGIWVMHFIAMLSFATPGLPVRFEISRTVLSAILSVSAVFAGLMVFGVRRKFALWRLLVGGLIMGLAVNLMHYTGMWALQVKGSIGFNGGLVLLSIVIAVVAATAALWFTVAFDSVTLRIVAGMIMGVAVVGMHYTGMAAVRVQLDANAPNPDGVEGFNLLFPTFVVAAIALVVPICAVLMASTPAEKDAQRRSAELVGEPAATVGS